MSTTVQRPQRLVFASGLVIGLSILGDSLLYAILPLEAAGLGIALPLVGILLSANRLVRLASNTWAGALFERLGPRWPFAASAALGVITTALYGVQSGFLVFLLARIGWGLAWSGLRQGGYQAVWAGDSARKGRLMGLLWGLVRLGSAFSVLLGGFLRDRFGYFTAVLVVTLVSTLSLPVALSMRWPKTHAGQSGPASGALEGWQEAFRTSARRWILITGFMETLLEAVLVSTAALFLTARLADSEMRLAALGVGIGTATGVLLAVRWVAGLFFGPLAGALSDRFGMANALGILSLVLVGGVAVAVTTTGLLPLAALSIALLAGSGLFVTLNAAASEVALSAQRPNIFVGVFSTAIDAGMAAGPLIAFTLGGATGLAGLYLAITVLFGLAILRFRSTL